MVYSHPFQRPFLQIELHHIQFAHGIAHRGSCCEHDAPAVVDFIKVLAFQVHVHCLLGTSAGYARHVVDFGGNRQIFKMMRLVLHDGINAQFLKGNQVILAAFLCQFL